MQSNINQHTIMDFKYKARDYHRYFFVFINNIIRSEIVCLIKIKYCKFIFPILKFILRLGRRGNEEDEA